MMCNGLLLRMVRVIITLRHMPAIVLRMSMCLFGWLMSLRVAMRRLLDLFEFWWVGLLLVTVEHIQLFCVLLDIHAIRGLDFVMLVVVCVWLLNLFCLNWRSEIYAFPSLFKLLFYVTRLGNGRHFYFNITILGRLDSLFNLHSLDYSRLLVIIRAGGLRFIYGLNFQRLCWGIIEQSVRAQRLSLLQIARLQNSCLFDVIKVITLSNILLWLFGLGVEVDGGADNFGLILGDRVGRWSGGLALPQSNSLFNTAHYDFIISINSNCT